MDWTNWHERYEISLPLRERLSAVRTQIVLALSKVAAEPVQVISICAGDGRDLIGSLVAFDQRKTVRASLIEMNAELVAKGQTAIDHFCLSDQVTFRCGDATQSGTYVGISPAHVVVLSGVFGNLKENDVRRLIVSLQSLCHRGASVIWTRNLVEFDDGEKATQMIRKCFLAADFREEVLARTPQGVFAVGTHTFQGEPRPLPEDGTLFEFTGFWGISDAV